MVSTEGVWVFGYGSLVWKVDFPVEEQKFGYIVGFARRFWQKSHDHRGTPESPGLVATLVPQEELRKLEKTPEAQTPPICWGMAYKLKSGQEKEILDPESFNSEDDKKSILLENALVYIGKTDNPSFGGPIDTKAIAKKISVNVGPSGRNLDYLVNLCESLRMNSPMAIDDHLSELESLIKLENLP
ncbi:hypothetical protein BB560_000830 [Smittium megazygosporum]|uniref:glutathione-specific gamma-glutamylcyclotransferase n=1 Tax=Smittium megazygosporum TaxID=133381 RepID=A0A2T9ZJC6_9FUNG|nr:hypothetical protein BB560_000830 [Smittium megazygosporum]